MNGRAAALFIPSAPTPKAPTIAPFAVTTTANPLAANPATVTTAPPSEVESQSTSYSPPLSVRTFTLVLKLSITAAVLIGGAYFTMNSIVPAIKELSHPAGAVAAPDKDASTFVKAIRQTKQVVAKNDANVAYLNAVVDADIKGTVATAPPPVAAKAPVPVPAAPAPAPVNATTYAPATPIIVEVRSSSAPVSNAKLRPYNDAIADLQIGGVVGGRSPRILIDGLLIQIGETVVPALKLTFIGVDEEKHLVFFENQDHVIFQRSY